jgi:glycerate-2-kinase
MTILPKLRQDETFCAFATDGIDNSDSAGVILDETTKQRSSALHLDSEEFRAHFAGYTFFHKLGHEQIFTGNTESNVSDVMIIMRK